MGSEIPGSKGGERGRGREGGPAAAEEEGPAHWPWSPNIRPGGAAVGSEGRKALQGSSPGCRVPEHRWLSRRQGGATLSGCRHCPFDDLLWTFLGFLSMVLRGLAGGVLFPLTALKFWDNRHSENKPSSSKVLSGLHLSLTHLKHPGLHHFAL